MLNCNWVRALTAYDCRPVRTKHGEAGLEVGTPFSLPGGAAVNVYLIETGNHIRLTDNADTLFQLGGLGLDVWGAGKHRALRDVSLKNGLAMGEDGDLFLLSNPQHAQWHFAKFVSGLLAVGTWARDQMAIEHPPRDLAAEAEPYLVAWRPTVELKRHVKVQGASRVRHQFDFQMGPDLIDVISAHPNATGGAMRKVGDVINGPYADAVKPLIILDDRTDPAQADSELRILSSFTRVMTFTRLQHPTHQQLH
jgi:hypothetical protein